MPYHLWLGEEPASRIPAHHFALQVYLFDDAPLPAGRSWLVSIFNSSTSVFIPESKFLRPVDSRAHPCTPSTRCHKMTCVLGSRITNRSVGTGPMLKRTSNTISASAGGGKRSKFPQFFIAP